MAVVILDGKATAEKIKAQLKPKVDALKRRGVTPGLAAVLIGDNPSSQLYVKLKQKACDDVGMYSEKHELSESTTEKELIKLIEKLNSNKKVHGILVQMPLPKYISVKSVVKAIAPEKDVDGFNPYNNGAVMDGEEFLVSATPKGVIRLLEEYGIGLEGKEVVVVNHTIVLGRPLSMLLMNRNATVIVCNHKTRDLKGHTLKAEVLITGVGKPKLITGDMVKEGCVVVDAGISVIDGKVVGDVDFEAVKEKASHITPVPGGVGPMTIAMLLENTILAASRK